jgi:hypothetical protein
MSAPSYAVSVSSVADVWDPSAQPPSPQPYCSPVLKTGVAWLDQVVFCIGGYGVTVLLVLAALILLILLIRR